MGSNLVSIIIPTYNRAHLIGETLESVLAQTHNNWECLVIDDGSTDDTTEVIEKYSKSDSRFKYYQRPNSKIKGASSCRNFGFEKSNGELIQYLDSDDLLGKEKLSEQIRILNEVEKKVLLTCKWGGFNESNQIYKLFKGHYHIYNNFEKGIDLIEAFGIYGEYFPPHVYLTPRKLIEKSGLWNEQLTNNDDGEFFVRVILNASKILFSPDAHVFYRNTSPDKLSVMDSEDKIISAILSWKLIEQNIKKCYPKIIEDYWNNAKTEIYNKAKKDFPKIIRNNQDFFKFQIQQDKLYKKILKKLRNKFFR